jgi:hypothetical protein
MDEFTVDAFVNRDEPIPVISFDSRDDLSDEADEPSDIERKHDRLRRHGKNIKDNVRSTGTSMQDRILEK